MRSGTCTIYLLLHTYVHAGLRNDAKQDYTAEEVNASSHVWSLNATELGSSHGIHTSLREHAQAELACAQRDSTIVRANSDTKSYLSSGAWCLPEGNGTGSLVELPNGQSYMIPKVHAMADAVILPFLNRLLRGCTPIAAAKAENEVRCDKPPRHSIIDLGAGVGQYGHSLQSIDSTHNYRGYDGAGNVERFTSGFVRWIDMTNPLLALPKADWVMSLEVGEHINSLSEKYFVRNLHTHNCRGLILSWGVLGQWGRGHVNNHGERYITRVFTELGYIYDVAATKRLREQHVLRKGRHATQSNLAPGLDGPHWWFARSLYVFRRTQPQTGPGCESDSPSTRFAMRQVKAVEGWGRHQENEALDGPSMRRGALWGK